MMTNCINIAIIQIYGATLGNLWCLECEQSFSKGDLFCSSCGRNFRQQSVVDRGSYGHLLVSGFTINLGAKCPKCSGSPVFAAEREVASTSNSSYLGCNPIFLLAGLITNFLFPPKEKVQVKTELACPICHIRWFQ